jgi:putative DNA primase/helicase
MSATHNGAAATLQADSPAAKVAGLLSPKHLADLRASGLQDETILAAELRTIKGSDRATIRQILNWGKYDGSLGDVLLFPYFGDDGKVNGFKRLKPDNPRSDTKDKEKKVKYETPKGATNHAYILPQVISAVKDPSIPLLLTEGEKKTLAAVQSSFVAVGIAGVWNWTSGKDCDGNQILIDDLKAIVWKGRSVFIVFDSDIVRKESVLFAEWKLAETLIKLGAFVRCVRLPDKPSNVPGGVTQKNGLDDFLVEEGANGPAILRVLMSNAKEAVPPAAGKSPIESPDDPHRLARLFRDEHCSRDANLVLRRWREEWHRWDGAAYRVVPDDEVRGQLSTFAKAEMDRENMAAQLRQSPDSPPPVAISVTGRLISDVTGALAGMTMLPAKTEVPAWLTGGPFPASETLPCRNVLVHLPSLIAGKGCLVQPTPQFFSQVALEFDFDAKAPQPIEWLKFLDTVWPDDSESTDTLQEWFGYCLLPDTSQQKILMMHGPKRGGKGTIARVLRKLIGEANVANPKMSSLGTEFGLSGLLGKTLAILADARLTKRGDTQAIIETLLSISGEDHQDVNRKHKSILNVKLPTRFVLLVNEMPKLNDAGGALAGRLIILKMTESFFGREDRQLTDRLLGELPSILSWAIHGWKRLNDRGKFEQPKSAAGLADDMADLSSPVAGFVRQWCKVAPHISIDVPELFEAWKYWCKKANREHCGDAGTFGRNVRAAVPTIDGRQHRKDGDRVRAYFGIGLDTHAKEEIESMKASEKCEGEGKRKGESANAKTSQSTQTTDDVAE